MYRIALEQYPFSVGERTMKTRFIPQTRLAKQCLANLRNSIKRIKVLNIFIISDIYFLLGTFIVYRQ